MRTTLDGREVDCVDVDQDHVVAVADFAVRNGCTVTLEPWPGRRWRAYFKPEGLVAQLTGELPHVTAAGKRPAAEMRDDEADDAATP